MTAAADDRRTEALAAYADFAKTIHEGIWPSGQDFTWEGAPTPDTSMTAFQVYENILGAFAALAPYLHDDTTGGEG